MTLALSFRLARCSLCTTQLLKVTAVSPQQVATYMDLKIPPKYDNVEFPERRRLKFFDKVPLMSGSQRPPKMMKDLYDMRGPELIHNKIQYGEFAIQAIRGGTLRHGHLEMIRLTIAKKIDDSRMFAVWRVDQPWKSVTKKSVGQRMGSGKGPIDHYVFPVRSGRMIIEVGGKCQYQEVEKWMKMLAKILPFPARIVTKAMLEEEKGKEEEEKRKNINPFNFEYCAKNNFFGVKTVLSPYDYLWHGKHR